MLLRWLQLYKTGDVLNVWNIVFYVQIVLNDIYLENALLWCLPIWGTYKPCFLLPFAVKNTANGKQNLIWHYNLLPTGRRNRMPTVKTQHALKSLIQSSIKYLNQPHKINQWPIYHNPYHCHCSVVLSHLFIHLIILSYCFCHIYSSIWSILQIPSTYLYTWLYCIHALPCGVI